MELYKGLKEGKHYKDGGVTNYKSDLQLVEDEKTKSYYLFPNPSDKDSMGIKFKNGGYMAKGGKTDSEEVVYIQYRNAKKGFSIDKKYFKGEGAYKEAVKWGRKNIDNFNIDMVKFEMSNGGEMEEGIDLFEDYENIPNDVQEILDNYQEAFEDGDYRGLKMAHDELNKIGYTFEYYLDGQAYDLRKIGQKGKSEVMDNDDYAYGGYMAKGGEIEEYIVWVSKDGENREYYATVKSFKAAKIKNNKLWESGEYEKIGVMPKEKFTQYGIYYKDGGVTFSEKVNAVKSSLMKRKKVAPAVQKDYGKTYSPKEAEDSAKRIVGSQVAKYKRG
jgi:hypothetical protein